MSAHHWLIAAASALILAHAALAEPPTPAARAEAIVLRAGAPQTVAMKSGKAIRSGRSSNEAVAQVGPNEPDVKTVLLRGLRPASAGSRSLMPTAPRRHCWSPSKVK